MEPENASAAPKGAGGCPMHTPEFAADPQRIYERLRAQGPAASVELTPGLEVTLVTGHDAALRVLQNTSLFHRDARRWTALREGRVAMDNPALPMMMYRPNALFTDGAVHLRLRKAVTESMAKWSTTRIRRDVEPIADYLIDQLSERGRADLINDYAKLLPLLLFNKLFGCPANIGDTVASAMSAIFDGKDAVEADAELTASLMELVALKRRQPGDDLTSWLIQHPAGLTDEELKDQLMMLFGAGVEPERNLIGTALLLLLSPDGGQDSGLMVEEALDHVLWDEAPIANFAPHYPVQDVDFGGVVAKADTPVVISFAAANSDPVLDEARHRHRKGAHLAWGAGPHACPAKDPAQVIAISAIERLLNALPDLTLAVPEKDLQWRPGPFHRALVSLPVTFTPAPATRLAAALHSRNTSATGQQPQAQTAAAPARTAAVRRKGFWSTFLDVFRV